MSLRFVIVLALMFPTLGTLFFFAETVREQREESRAAEELESAIRLTAALRSASVWLSPEGTINATVGELLAVGLDPAELVAPIDGEERSLDEIVLRLRAQSDEALARLEETVRTDGALLTPNERRSVARFRSEVEAEREAVDTARPDDSQALARSRATREWFWLYSETLTTVSERIFFRATSEVPVAQEMTRSAAGLRSLQKLSAVIGATSLEDQAGLAMLPGMPGAITAENPMLTLASANAETNRAVTDYLRTAPKKHRRLLEATNETETAERYFHNREQLLVSAGLRDGEVLEEPIDGLEYAATAYERVQELAELPDALRDDVLANAAAGRNLTSERVRRSSLMAAAVFLGTALVALVALRALLRPLASLQERASRISAGLFEESSGQTWEPREVTVVSEALDGLSGTLSDFERQVSSVAAGEFEDPAFDEVAPGAMGQAMRRAVAQLTGTTAQLRESEETHRALVEHAADGILTVDADGLVTTSNPAAMTVFAKKCSELVGASLEDLFDVESAQTVKLMLTEAQVEGMSRVEGQVRTADTPTGDRTNPASPDQDSPDLDRPDQDSPDQARTAAAGTARSDRSQDESAAAVRDVLMSAAKHRMDGPSPMTVIVRDITERTQLQRELWKRSRTDDLTGLANRWAIHERIDGALSTRRRTPDTPAFALLFVDLDRFKQVNDTYGHGLGDGLLRVVAERLRCLAADFPAECFVGRVGGDEFVMMVDHPDQDDLADLGSAIVASLEEPVSLGRVRLEISASVGVAVSRDDMRSASDLLHEADLAVYSSKRGLQSVTISGDQQRRTWQRRQEIQADLRNALRARALFLELQPVVRLETGQTESWEALARWDRPGEGRVSPEEFIGIAEESDLVVDLGRWALDEAVRQAATLAAMSDAPNPVAVNISWRHVAQGTLFDDVKSALKRWDLDPKLLRLELTETQMPEDDLGIGILEAVHDLGVGLSLDDFGTGYSSITHLRRYPFSTLKLDRSLIISVEHDNNARGIVEILVNLALLLDLSLIAEGVETEGQAEVLNELGCAHAQGYLFGRPTAMADQVPNALPAALGSREK